MATRYTDTVDANSIISLYEYGILRNPVTGKCLRCLNASGGEHTKENKPVIRTQVITVDDVKECLEEISDGFFEFVGTPRKKYLAQLDEDYLASSIMAIDQWNSYFIQELELQ